RMVRIHADAEASDFCGPSTLILQSVTSDEPENSTGDGNTAPDIQGVDTGTADFDFFLRAERSGNGDGRVYTATYQATDASGNAASSTGQVLVPHDMGHGKGKGNGNNDHPGPPPGKGKNKGSGHGHGNGHGNGNGNGNH